jgi:cupin 2 domain-containing protein
MQIMSIEPENIFDLITDKLDQEVFETLIHSDNLKIERIISKGHTSPKSGWYDQQHNEWVIVLKGKACIAFENDREISLLPGDYINIPAHKRHKVIWTDPETETIWLAIHY